MWHRLSILWRNFARRRKVEDDLDHEIRSYQELLADEKGRSFADPDIARREALLELGGAEQIKEQVRDIRAGSTLNILAAELRQSFRGLRRNPALAILGTLMLALGIGSSTVVFSIFHAALVQPLPFRDTGRLVQLWETRIERGFNQASFTEANFWDVRTQNHSFEEVAAYHYDEANLTGIGPAEKVTNIEVSAGFFRTLGVSPILGRDFAYEEARPGFEGNVVILGHKFWKNRLGGDAQILGKILRLNDRACTVIGVLPPGEPWIDDQTYVPFGYRPQANRGSFEFQVIARIKPSVSTAAIAPDLERIAGPLGQTYPTDDKGIGFHMEPASTWVASDNTRRALWVLLAAVTFLLLIACLNLANLLLARGMARQREIAVRTALGAGRGRLVRFVMLESLLLSTFGCVLGLALAYVSISAIQAWEVPGIPRLLDAGLNLRVLGFAVGIALLTGVLAGLAPALQAPIRGIAAALRDGDRQAGSRGQSRLRAGLVTAEVALSFLLLVGAGLLIRSFTQLMSVDRGFHTENRLLFTVSFPGSYWEKGVGKQFLNRFFERLSAVPEILAVGSVNNRPVEGGNPGMGIDSAIPRKGATAPPWAGWRVISPGYFRAVGLPLLRGRGFQESDLPVWKMRGQPEPLRHVILSERLAKLILPEQEPVGQHVRLWKGQNGMDAEVVGVVADSRERGPASNPTLTVYMPYGANALTPEFVVHTRGNPLAVATTIRSLVAGLDPNLPVADVRTFEEVEHRSVAPQRLNAILLSIFSGLALLLATTGIYGVLSYSMSRRTSEIGLRVALGASGRSILGMTLGQGMQPALLGIVLGAGGACWLSRYFATLLFGIKPLDLVTYIAVAALLMATALVACYIPGRRAMRTDPAIALRSE